MGHRRGTRRRRQGAGECRFGTHRQAERGHENSGAVFAGVASRLGWPLLTGVIKIVDIANGQISVERMVDGGQESVTVKLPAVVSVGKEIG